MIFLNFKKEFGLYNYINSVILMIIKLSVIADKSFSGVTKIDGQKLVNGSLYTFQKIKNILYEHRFIQKFSEENVLVETMKVI